MSGDNCKIHPEINLRCMAGRSAHPSNWYCELCDASDEHVIDSYNDLGHDRAISLPVNEMQLHDEILRRMRITV